MTKYRYYILFDDMTYYSYYLISENMDSASECVNNIVTVIRQNRNVITWFVQKD